MFLRKPRLFIGHQPLGRQTRAVTMLYAQESASGFVGYSSFEDDQFGELRGPQPLPGNDLLALHKLPGGGEYIVFDGNAVDTLKGMELALGDTAVKLKDADSIGYNATSLRTQAFFGDDHLTMVAEEEYPVSLSDIAVANLSFGIDGGGSIEMDAVLVDDVFLGFVADLGGELTAQVKVTVKLGMAGDLGGESKANIFPPTTLVAHGDLGGSMNLNVVRKVRLGMVGELGGAATVAVTRRVLLGMVGTLSGELMMNVNLFVPPDADAQNLIAAMTVTPNDNRAKLINDTIKKLKQQGFWSRIYLMNMYSAHDSQAALLDWKTPTRLSQLKGSAPLFTMDSGFRAIDFSSFIDLNYNLAGMPSDGNQWGMTFKFNQSATPTTTIGTIGLGINTGATSLYWGLNPGNALASQQIVKVGGAAVNSFGTGSIDLSKILTAKRNGGNQMVYSEGNLSFSVASTHGTPAVPAAFDVMATAASTSSDNPSNPVRDRNQQMMIIHTLFGGELNTFSVILKEYLAALATTQV